MAQTISIIISIVSGIICGGSLFFMTRYFSKKDNIDTIKEEINAKENILILRSINAIGKLTLANSIALRDGKTNSEMTSALLEYSSVEKELYNYLLDVNSKK